MAMTMERALDVLGSNRTRDGDLRPMVKALGLHPWLNGPAEIERKAAAEFVLRRWPQYQEACNAARDARRRRV